MSKRTALVLAFVLGAPALAQAQTYSERRSPLADAPAVRRRVELRDKRFELGVGAGATIGQDFYNAILVGPKLGFHLTNWLAISGIAQFNLTKNYKTTFTSELDRTLPAMTERRTPGRAEALGAMSKISQIYGVQAELIPFTGKLALFNSWFANYDFYGFGGLGFVNFEAERAACTDARPSCPDTGMKMGANFGLGMRTFINEMFALNFEVRDILLKNNPAGRDTNGDTVADDRDKAWGNNFIVSLNVMIFLPTKGSVGD